MVDDAILSREAYLIYQNAWGYEPDQGSLLRWIGKINDRVGKTIPVRFELPSDYPRSPPNVFLPDSVQHPNISNGKFITRTISRWKSSYHVYQVMKEVNTVIHASDVRYSSTPQNEVSQSSQDGAIKRQISILRDQLIQKQNELNELSASPIEQINISKSEVTRITNDSMVQLQNEMYSLEDDYDRADIDGLEFSKKFLQLQKRYYLLERTSSN